MLRDAALDRYRAVYRHDQRFQPSFYPHFVEHSSTHRPAIVLVTHCIAFTVILLALVSREFIPSRRKRQQRAPQ